MLFGIWQQDKVTATHSRNDSQAILLEVNFFISWSCVCEQKMRNDIPIDAILSRLFNWKELEVRADRVYVVVQTCLNIAQWAMN